ncbi:sulfatase family protein [Sphaerochaeta globosa]|uniref:Sulfatase n=1 Tax=Sphaerochaeta globosa (strain ATCC BAA-1886 / DSM 22777 / Buddy) TaxID=158189 RepID=F0RXR9_SPHGB|nr:sulfatase-like hydrolase/transferase [Sphaerochaeta globosa]ADY12196.1 sulfatase [Sphaerochaeta globosa str. Buddy]
MQEKPNILMIFTDQQRWDTLAAYGNQKIHTPNLDRLAAQGVVFETAITPCPLCMPARASVMTGKSSSALQCMENSYPKSVDNRETIAGLLAESGYHCQAIGKMHFSNTPYEETYGMHHMILSEETRGVRTAKKADDIVLDDYDKFLAERKLWGWDKPTEIGYNEIKPLVAPLPKETHVTQWCGDQTVAWLKECRPKNKPFFLWSSFVKPHVPYDCPQHLLAMYDPAQMDEPWVSEQDGCSLNPYFASYRKAKEFDLYSEEAGRKAKAYYYANITFIDEQVGRILDALDEQGLADSTLVIFSSDHGDLLGDHRLWYKCFGFEGSLRVPLLMRLPDHLHAGTRYEGLTSLLDLFPTILDAAGLNHRYTDRPGISLLDMLEGKDGHERVFSEVMDSPYTMSHVRTAQYKYLFYQNGAYEQLFDLGKDPMELHDLAGDSRYEQVRQSLRDWAESYIAEYGNPKLHLDEKGSLRSEPYHVHTEPKQRPFSRMPWDGRFPSDEQTLFFTKDRRDWLDALQP